MTDHTFANEIKKPNKFSYFERIMQGRGIERESVKSAESEQVIDTTLSIDMYLKK